MFGSKMKFAHCDFLFEVTAIPVTGFKMGGKDRHAKTAFPKFRQVFSTATLTSD